MPDSSVGAAIADQCGDCPDEGAVDQEYEAEVLLRGADGSEHAELAESPLSDDRESCGCDERRQKEEDRGDREHRQGLRLLFSRLTPGPPECGLAVVIQPRPGAVDPGVDRSTARVDKNRHMARRPRGRGGDKRELIAELARVLDDADDGPATSVKRHGRPDLDP
jgi:hypothetical protein